MLGTIFTIEGGVPERAVAKRRYPEFVLTERCHGVRDRNRRRRGIARERWVLNWDEAPPFCFCLGTLRAFAFAVDFVAAAYPRLLRPPFFGGRRALLVLLSGLWLNEPAPSQSDMS